MALTCTPSALIQAAKCFECLTPAQQAQVQTYLLAVIAGLPTTQGGVSLMLQASKCFSCLTPAQQQQVMVYLECYIQASL